MNFKISLYWKMFLSFMWRCLLGPFSKIFMIRLYVGDLDDMYKVSRRAKRYLTIWRNGNSVVNVLRFSVIYFRLMTLFPNDPIVTFLYWQEMTRQILVSRKKKEFCPMRGPPYSICNIVQSKSDNDIKIVWYHILKFQHNVLGSSC